MSLILLPATRENLEKSVEHSVDAALADKYLPVDVKDQIRRYSGIEGIRCWAMTKSSARLFSRISNGDEVLLSEKGTGLFNYYAVVVGKTINHEFGTVLWPYVGKNPWDNIFFLGNITRVTIQKSQFVQELGYAKNLAVQGPLMIADDAYKKLGSVSSRFEIPVFDKVAEAHVDGNFLGESVECIGTRRIGHSKFSKHVKSNYSYSCAVCGIKEVEFLVSSHISPWCEDFNNRLNPSNGICLCSMHDKAFEHGFIGIDDNFCVLVTGLLDKSSLLYNELKRFEGTKIFLPSNFPPDKSLLAKHREKNNLV
jgi:hypothetical protein